MTDSVDLLIYTYQSLIPLITGQNPPKKGKIIKLIEETSLPALLSKEEELQVIASEVPNSLDDIQRLFKAKAVLLGCEAETLTVGQASKIIDFLGALKTQVQRLDSAACVEDFISNLDQTIAESNLQQLSEWAQVIKTIPVNLGSHDTFLPILSIRLKSLIWNKMTTTDMQGHIDLAKTLLECTGYKDLELNDLIEIIMDQCLDFIETVNDFFNIEGMQGNPVQEDREGTRELLGYLKQVDVANKDFKSRLVALEEKYGSNAPVMQQNEIRLNEIRSIEEFKLTDKIFYSHTDPMRVQTIVRGGIINSGNPVAVKIYTSETQADFSKYQCEVDALKILSGQKRCFLQFYGAILEENSLYIITEVCDKSLQEDMTIRKRDNRSYTYEERLSIMTELLDGFAFMHYKKIHHQDIKPQNIMFTAQNVLKIIDYNIIIQTEDIEITVGITGEHPIQGTKHWMSPEVLEAFLSNQESGQKKKHDYKPGKSDVFSLGLVFLKLFTFDELIGLNSRQRNEELQKIVRDKVEPESLKLLISRMLLVDHTQRPSFRRAYGELPGSTTKIN